MVSRTILAAVAALVFVAAGCQAPVGTGQGAASSDGNTTITVSATGQASAAPEVALVRVAVVATADTADATRRQAADRTARMRRALRDAGVPNDSVRTAYFDIAPTYGRNGSEITGYRAVHGFELRADADRAGDAIDVAVRNGADRVEGVSFTLTDETRRELRTEALGRAMGSARDDADAVASAAGVEITGVRSASTADFGIVPFEGRLEAGDGGTVIEPGPVTVTASVSVTYRAQ